MPINLQSVPTDPGAYLYKDKQDNIIYVGKAKNLKKRVTSYFRKTDSIKTQVLVKNINKAEFIIVDNEVEALLLENKLIKKHKPKYNIHLKDSKTYAYIALSKDKFPRIYSTRQAKNATIFGPYTDGYSRKQVIDLSVKLFKLRTCRTLPKRACLNFYINLCTAPCVKKDINYQDQVDRAIEFLKGKTSPIIKQLKVEMKQASSLQKYEVALEKRNQINAIEILDQKQKVDLIKSYDQNVVVILNNNASKNKKAIITLFSIKKGVISGKKTFKFKDPYASLFEDFIKLYYSQNYVPSEIIINNKFYKSTKQKETIEKYLSNFRGNKVNLTLPQKGDKKKLTDLALKNASYELDDKVLLEIQEKLNLPTLPNIIECFDISNLAHTNIVAGMTRWVDRKADKENYRKFKIRSVIDKNDDFQSMREVVYRRYKRLVDENEQMPDLIIIDGGIGQVNSALTSLKILGLSIPLIGLAKKEELIILPNGDSLDYDNNSPMMLYLRKIRNSVHKLAIGYNRSKRKIVEK
jgi:excinuclease ABC subunit C